ncbi:MAG: YqaJ viral recombinase family protein [Gammaproteobacteria bacterium]|nr:YqaJ viral recombinase family protein [Gammaproteobacteria bacterium]
MKIIESMEQGSKEWLELRVGKVTASKFKDVMTNGRGDKPSATAKTYMIKLVSEILRGEPMPFFENEAMKWGTETEPQARAMYELKNGVDVKEVAFVELNEFVGVSPDGLVGDDGLLEIKCPNTETQIKRFLDDVGLPKDYEAQVQGQLWVTGRDWCDFVSFDPRIDVEASYIQTRVYRDEEYIAKLEKKVSIFVGEMKEMINKLTGEK